MIIGSDRNPMDPKKCSRDRVSLHEELPFNRVVINCTILQRLRNGK